MKKIITLIVFALVMFGFVQFVKASSEEVRYWEYVHAELLKLNDGGRFDGQIYESNPGCLPQENGRRVSFASYFNNNCAKTVVNCEVGWYQAYASWKDKLNDTIFYSQYIEQTYLDAGLQTMPFPMVANQSRTIRFTIDGAMISDADSVYFNGNQAYRDGDTWKAGIDKPWNVIGTEVEVVWTGHGGWRIPISQDSINGIIAINTGDMDKTLLAPTRLKAVSFLGENCLNGNQITCTRIYYSQEFGCQVLEIQSAFPGDIGEFNLVLNGYEQYAGSRVNYFTMSLENVGGTFIVPLGSTYIRPETYIKVCLLNPETGEYVQTNLWLDELWYSGGKG